MKSQEITSDNASLYQSLLKARRDTPGCSDNRTILPVYHRPRTQVAAPLSPPLVAVYSIPFSNPPVSLSPIKYGIRAIYVTIGPCTFVSFFRVLDSWRASILLRRLGAPARYRWTQDTRCLGVFYDERIEPHAMLQSHSLVEPMKLRF